MVEKLDSGQIAKARRISEIAEREKRATRGEWLPDIFGTTPERPALASDLLKAAGHTCKPETCGCWCRTSYSTEWKPVIYRGQMGSSPKCKCKPVAAAPQPVSGDAPKVEDIARKIWDEANDSADVLAILRPYFPPAGQTDDKRVENTFDKLAYEGFFEDVQDWSPLSRDECMKILRELATPASTARTDGWVSVEERLPEYGTVSLVFVTEGDGLPYQDLAGYSYHGGWGVGTPIRQNVKVTHWQPLPAAPGSVPPPDLAFQFKEELDAKLHKALNPGVPQAEPPKSFLGLPVYVDNPQFTGYGMAAYDSGDRKRVIGVLLENGHTWEYDAATVREARHEELPKMPRFIRERFKPGAGAAQPGDDKPGGAE